MANEYRTPEPAEEYSLGERRDLELQPYSQSDLATHNSQGLVHRDNMQEHLARSLGKYVIAEFLIGTHGSSYREGVLTQVGNSYFVLYDEQMGTTVTCDLFSLKFITVLRPGARPGRANTVLGNQQAAGRGLAAAQSNIGQNMADQWLGQGSPWDTYPAHWG